MADKIVHENLVSIDGDKLRVERGPRRMKGTATPELLRRTGRSVPGDNIKLAGGRVQTVTTVYDALGKPVEMGKPMTYLDKNAANRVWYLYRWETVETTDGPRDMFVEKGICKGSRDEAVTECKAKYRGAV